MTAPHKDQPVDELRNRIKKECFGFDDDELDTQIAYRDVLDVVGNIEKLIQAECNRARKNDLENIINIVFRPQTYVEVQPKDRFLP